MMKEKRGFGPQPKQKEDRKTVCVMVRFTTEESELLDDLRDSVRRAEWLHDCALQQKPVPQPRFPQVNQAVWVELAQGLQSMQAIRAEVERMHLADPDSEMAWKTLSQSYVELMAIAHQVRDGLLKVIEPNPDQIPIDTSPSVDLDVADFFDRLDSELIGKTWSA